MTPEELMTLAYGRPDPAKYTLPQFSTTPAAAGHLPSPARCADGSPEPPPFEMEWTAADFAMRVTLKELPEGDVWAYLHGSRDDVGKATRVFLAADGTGEVVSHKVVLEAAGDHCKGRVSFGTLADIRAELKCETGGLLRLECTRPQ